MKKLVIYFSVFLVIMMFVLASTVVNAEKTQSGLKAFSSATPLPESLDNLFPPKAQAPLFLFAMHGMARPFTGIMVDLLEKDFDNAMANYNEFRSQFAGVSKLVPEWTEYFATDRVDNLGEALKSGDQGKIMAAYEQVAEVCANCHFTNMPKVHAKYHWPRFHDVTVTDPLTKEEINFPRLMQYIEVNFLGIGIDLEQGQTENARKHMKGLRARYDALEESCMHCHDTERHYFVDENVQKMLSELENVVMAAKVDAQKVGEYEQKIGMESCFKCHLVHVPAAAQQIRGFK